MSKLGKGKNTTDEPDQRNQENGDDNLLHHFGQNSRTDSKSLYQKSGTMDSDMLKKQQRNWKKISLGNEQPQEKAGLSDKLDVEGEYPEHIITAVVSTISIIILVSIIAVLAYFFPEAFSQLWDVVKKNVDEGKTMISDNVEAAAELLTETQNPDTITLKSLYDRFISLF